MNTAKSHIDKSEILGLLKDLVRINSVNPSLVEGAPGEEEIANFIADYMKAIGLETYIEEVETGRPNVVGVLKGSENGPILLLNGHMDTVGIDYMEIDPLNPVVKDGKLYGRGSFDMKGGLAAILATAKAVSDSGEKIHGDLVVAAVCDEEYRSIGTDRLVETIKADAAIVAEPTELQIVVAHKGFAWIGIETQGIAAHGSRPEEGVDAITKMGKFLVELENLQKGILQQKQHELVGSPSVHASIIHGGRELSTYPDHCKLQIERRMIPGENQEDLENEIDSLFRSIQDLDPQFDGKYNVSFVRGPMEVSPQESICQIVKECIIEVTEQEPQFIGASYWLDSEIIWKKGTPVVAFGPSGEGAHAAVEYVDTDSVVDVAKVLEQVIMRFCRP